MSEIEWDGDMARAGNYYAKISEEKDGWYYEIARGHGIIKRSVMMRRDGAYITDESARCAADWALRGMLS